MARGTGRRLQATVLQSVIEHIAAGENNSEIYRATGVPRCVRLGRPPIMLAFHVERLQEFLLGRPHAYLQEMRQYLYEEFDVDCSIATVCNTLVKIQYSRKIATKRARE